MSTEIVPVDGEEIVQKPHEAAIVPSDTLAQLDAAHRYPRSIAGFLKEATTLATRTGDIAASCIYSLPRGGNQITGPSVRLAEIVATAYGNLQIGGRLVEVGERTVTAEGVAWDMQRNIRVTERADRRITRKDGSRYDDDMIGVAAAAARSVAIRQAIFRTIPRAYVMEVYEAARRVAVGDHTTLVDKRSRLMTRLMKLGLTMERVLARVGCKGLEDVGLEQMEILIGLGTAIKESEISPDDAFPAVVVTPANGEQEGRRIALRGSTQAPETSANPQPSTSTAAPTRRPDKSPGQVITAYGAAIGLSTEEMRNAVRIITGQVSRSKVPLDQVPAVKIEMDRITAAKKPPEARGHEAEVNAIALKLAEWKRHVISGQIGNESYDEVIEKCGEQLGFLNQGEVAQAVAAPTAENLARLVQLEQIIARYVTGAPDDEELP